MTFITAKLSKVLDIHKIGTKVQEREIKQIQIKLIQKHENTHNK